MTPQKKNATTRRKSQSAVSARCGLCGKARKLTRTECCDHWICDDEGQYVLFSYARNSCDRNPLRYTLCGYHHAEEHLDRWTECQQKCREDFETEMYVWYGTNAYNFEKLKNPPAYEPTRCAKCQEVISLSQDAYSEQDGTYRCEACSGVA